MRTCGIGMVLGLVGAAASGQQAMVSLVAPSSVAPGESFVVQVVGDISSLPTENIIAGFGLDVDATGAVSQLSSATFGTFAVGTDSGTASSSGLSGVIAGQLPNLLDINPAVETGDVQTLFEFSVQTDANASGDIVLSLSDAQPNGGLIVFASSTSGASEAASVVFVGATVSVEVPCLADVNQDGSVNGLDFGAWLGAFNAQSPLADQNQDGQINGLDFGAWLGNFNAGCP